MIEKEINVDVKLRLKGPAEEMDNETASVLLSVQRAVMDHWFHVGLTTDDSNVCVEQTPLVRLQRADPAKLTEVLVELVETINATGGVTHDGCPVGDPVWMDLGVVYAKACKALGVPVQVETREFEHAYKCAQCRHEWKVKMSVPKDDVGACDDACPVCGVLNSPFSEKTPQKWFTNKYKCSDCDHEWESGWTCACDEDCPECGLCMTPYESTDA